MRKVEQDKLLSLINTLSEVHFELKTQASIDVVCALLADAQNFTQQIINYINTLTKEETKTASLLQELYKVYYHAYIDKDINQYLEQLKTLLYSIESSVHNELKPNRIEVAFFPYKASMADSLQSIWEAALQDPMCDVVVCPIPYFDRNPDGTLGNMHYEVDGYPTDLPLTNWQTYDVHARRPDVVYIHNPYDSLNIVTTVHPNFYAQKLRECTDMLVYVPYFVSMQTVDEHFCTIPGCVFAHKVIVQSEGLREKYIKHFKKAYGDRFGNIQDKFVALGSPKFDKVLSTKREDCALLPGWKEYIGAKKVVLLCTSIGTMLSGGENYINKLRYIIEQFSARDDVALWWRPHPLTESTLESMRPGLVDDYRRIVQEFRSCVIYDDTPDLNRAIAMSDGYYGDYSSVVALYQETGKPVVTTDNAFNLKGQVESAPYNNINFYFLTADNTNENTYWGCSVLTGALYELDSLSQKAKWRCSGSGTSLMHSHLYAVPVDERVFLIPFNSYNVVVFNKKSGATQNIPLDKKYTSDDNGVGGMKLIWGYAIDDTLYMFGSRHGIIVELNLKTNKIHYNLQVRSWAEKYAHPVKNVYEKDTLRIFKMFNKKHLWIYLRGTTDIISYDIKAGTCSKIVTLPYLSECENICFGGDCVWIVPKGHRELVKWEHETGKITTYSGFPSDLNYHIDKLLFTQIVNCKECLLMFPRFGNMVVKFNKQSGSFEKFADIPIDNSYDTSVHIFDAAVVCKGKIVASNVEDKSTYIVDQQTLKVQKKQFTIQSESYNNFLGDVHELVSTVEGHKFIVESWFAGNPISGFLDCVNYKEINSDEFKHTNENSSGYNIYNYLKSLVCK